MEDELPFDAAFDRAANRRFRETAVFVHHFGGDRRSTLRHARALNEIGFDCVRFTLPQSREAGAALARSPLAAAWEGRGGLRHAWTERTRRILDAVPGPKIVYSFSMPSASALQAVAERDARDVSAMICDGGPFLRLATCVSNLLEFECGVRSRFKLYLFTAASFPMWGVGYRRDMGASAARLPAKFPILSIRGGSDPLVPAGAIDDVWALPTRAQIERFAIADGRHLDGLRRFPDSYVARVRKFLESHATLR